MSKNPLTKSMRINTTPSLRAQGDKRGNQQLDAFISAARELGCDELESHFNEALSKIARVKPSPGKPEKIKKPNQTKPAK